MQHPHDKLSPAENALLKVTANDTIRNLIRSINMDSKKDFYVIVERYIATMPISSGIRHDIKRLLNEKPLMLTSLDDLPREIKHMVSSSNINNSECVYVNNSIKETIDELLIEWENAEAFKYHNLPVRRKMLLHGITGNGKTTIARHIARLVNLPFVEINTAMIIDSHIGTSSTNIHNLISKLKAPCVMFWDEIDSIGKRRGDSRSAADHENDRMVNTMLVNMEKMSDDIIFIGATNRLDILDSAFLRRFDLRINVPAPEDSEKYSFLEALCSEYKIPEVKDSIDAKSLISYSDIKLEFMYKARKHVLKTIKEKLPV